MSRAATTSDVFNAVGEARRRDVLDALRGGERSVNDLVDLLGMAQPQVSKHLKVLRTVGLAEVREAGRQRLYRLNSAPLRLVYDWVRAYEAEWEARFTALDKVLEELKQDEEKP